MTWAPDWGRATVSNLSMYKVTFGIVSLHHTRTLNNTHPVHFCNHRKVQHTGLIGPCIPGLLATAGKPNSPFLFKPSSSLLNSGGCDLTSISTVKIRVRKEGKKMNATCKDVVERNQAIKIIALDE